MEPVFSNFVDAWNDMPLYNYWWVCVELCLCFFSAWDGWVGRLMVFVRRPYPSDWQCCLVSPFHSRLVAAKVQIFCSRWDLGTTPGPVWGQMKSPLHTGSLYAYFILFILLLILTGGLTAVIYTDTLCTFLMVTGSLTVMGLGNFVYHAMKLNMSSI